MPVRERKARRAGGSKSRDGLPKAGASFRSGRRHDGATRPGGCAHLERLAALRVFVDPRLGGSVGIPCHGARSVPRAARTSGAWLRSGLM